MNELKTTLLLNNLILTSNTRATKKKSSLKKCIYGKGDSMS